MPFAMNAQQLDKVLLFFFFWLSLFVCLTALVVFWLIGVSVYRLVKKPARSSRSVIAKNQSAIVLPFPSALQRPPVCAVRNPGWRLRLPSK
jgi:Na+/H+-dicarboxylate symporter